eukprot:scaffold3231_cov184-Amphora_coffeaeformis.AAC.3
MSVTPERSLGSSSRRWECLMISRALVSDRTSLLAYPICLFSSDQNGGDISEETDGMILGWNSGSLL